MLHVAANQNLEFIPHTKRMNFKLLWEQHHRQNRIRRTNYLPHSPFILSPFFRFPSGLSLSLSLVDRIVQGLAQRRVNADPAHREKERKEEKKRERESETYIYIERKKLKETENKKSKNPPDSPTLPHSQLPLSFFSFFFLSLSLSHCGNSSAILMFIRISISIHTQLDWQAKRVQHVRYSKLGLRRRSQRNGEYL